MKKMILLFIAAALVLSCNEKRTYWDCSEAWYMDAERIDTNLVDVFYLVSTEVLSSKDSVGNVLFNAPLTTEERKAITSEMRFARALFGDSLNFFSPYYHQFTIESLRLPSAEFESGPRKTATDDAYEAFEYYMRKYNGGRRFILAGFSQGAMLISDLLKRISADEYDKMVAAYMMGYRIASSDLQFRYIVPAKGEKDLGVVISFNSTQDTSAVWKYLVEDAATCINPLNWRTDCSPAILDYNGDKAVVGVDTVKNVLVVDGLDTEKYRFPLLEEFYEIGCLHHWDLFFYNDAIRKNALLRSYGK